MKDEKIDNNQEGMLDLKDLLVDEQADELSKYLSLSIENLGDDTLVSVTTVESNPTTYSSTLVGVSFNDLHFVMDENVDLSAE